MMFTSSQSLYLIIVLLFEAISYKQSVGLPAVVANNRDEHDLELILLHQNQLISSLKGLIENLRAEVSSVASSLSVQPCPPGFVYRPCVNSCYKVILEPLTWDQSQARCAKEYPGAHAAVVSSAEEDKVIVEYLKSFSASATQACRVLGGIGFYTSGQRIIPRACPKPFLWKQNTTTILPLTYTNWNPNQPDCARLSTSSTHESCLHYFDIFQYKWNDIACEDTMCAVCEVDK